MSKTLQDFFEFLTKNQGNYTDTSLQVDAILEQVNDLPSSEFRNHVKSILKTTQNFLDASDTGFFAQFRAKAIKKINRARYEQGLKEIFIALDQTLGAILRAIHPVENQHYLKIIADVCEKCIVRRLKELKGTDGRRDDRVYRYANQVRNRFPIIHDFLQKAENYAVLPHIQNQEEFILLETLKKDTEITVHKYQYTGKDPLVLNLCDDKGQLIVKKVNPAKCTENTLNNFKLEMETADYLYNRCEDKNNPKYNLSHSWNIGNEVVLLSRIEAVHLNQQTHSYDLGEFLRKAAAHETLYGIKFDEDYLDVILVQLMSATKQSLDAIHAAGAIQNDVAPRNVMLRTPLMDEDGMPTHYQAVLIDFGLGSPTLGKINDSRVARPLRWCDPFMLAHRQFTAMSDIFAFKITISNMLSIYLGQDESASIYHAHYHPQEQPIDVANARMEVGTEPALQEYYNNLSQAINVSNSPSQHHIKRVLEAFANYLKTCQISDYSPSRENSEQLLPLTIKKDLENDQNSYLDATDHFILSALKNRLENLNLDTATPTHIKKLRRLCKMLFAIPVTEKFTHTSLYEHIKAVIRIDATNVEELKSEFREIQNIPLDSLDTLYQYDAGTAALQQVMATLDQIKQAFKVIGQIQHGGDNSNEEVPLQTKLKAMGYFENIGEVYPSNYLKLTAKLEQMQSDSNKLQQQIDAIAVKANEISVALNPLIEKYQQGAISQDIYNQEIRPLVNSLNALQTTLGTPENPAADSLYHILQHKRELAEQLQAKLNTYLQSSIQKLENSMFSEENNEFNHPYGEITSSVTHLRKRVVDVRRNNNRIQELIQPDNYDTNNELLKRLPAHLAKQILNYKNLAEEIEKNKNKLISLQYKLKLEISDDTIITHYSQNYQTSLATRINHKRKEWQHNLEYEMRLMAQAEADLKQINEIYRQHLHWLYQKNLSFFRWHGLVRQFNAIVKSYASISNDDKSQDLRQLIDLNEHAQFIAGSLPKLDSDEMQKIYHISKKKADKIIYMQDELAAIIVDLQRREAEIRVTLQSAIPTENAAIEELENSLNKYHPLPAVSATSTQFFQAAATSDLRIMPVAAAITPSSTDANTSPDAALSEQATVAEQDAVPTFMHQYASLPPQSVTSDSGSLPVNSVSANEYGSFRHFDFMPQYASLPQPSQSDRTLTVRSVNPPVTSSNRYTIAQLEEGWSERENGGFDYNQCPHHMYDLQKRSIEHHLLNKVKSSTNWVKIDGENKDLVNKARIVALAKGLGVLDENNKQWKPMRFSHDWWEVKKKAHDYKQGHAKVEITPSRLQYLLTR